MKEDCDQYQGYEGYAARDVDKKESSQTAHHVVESDKDGVENMSP